MCVQDKNYLRAGSHSYVCCVNTFDSRMVVMLRHMGRRKFENSSIHFHGSSVTAIVLVLPTYFILVRLLVLFLTVKSIHIDLITTIDFMKIAVYIASLGLLPFNW